MAEAQDYDAVLDKLRNRFEDGRLLDWETVDAMDSLPFYAEGQNFIGVHAGVPVVGGKALHPSKATGEQLVYDRRFKDEDVLPEESKCVLFGHTPVRYLTNRDEIVFYPRKDLCRTAHELSAAKRFFDNGTISVHQTPKRRNMYTPS